MKPVIIMLCSKDGKYIYTISAATAEGIMTINESDLVSSLVADYSFADLDKVTFVRNNETYVATKKGRRIRTEILFK